ncbi:MAG TPA: FUSC family protein [Gammaproteobacteria bacterium]|nr:FUSC family protein [Gammaproteobacteria bacterium]
MSIITIAVQNWVRNERLIHSIKTALACFIGFLIGNYIHFQAMQWIVITTLVVMCAQMNVGSVMQKSYMRFLGTLAGSMLAIITLEFFGSDFKISMIVVLIAAMIFSFIATSNKSYNESGTLGAVTVAIILFGQNPSVQLGFERCLEISLGILIAALVSQFIFPVHARTHLRKNQSVTLAKIRVLYLNLFFGKPKKDNENKLGNLDEEIVKSLITQRKLASEARREKFGTSFNLNYFQQMLWYEKEIIRSIMFMFYAYQKISAAKIIKNNQELLNNFHQEIIDTLENISRSIEKNQNPDEIIIQHLETLKKTFSDVISLEEEERISLDTFLFCAEILVERLGKLSALRLP